MLYLASQSPQRSQLLTAADLSFTTVSSSCDEETIVLPHPQATAIERAIAKARGADRSACTLGSDCVILAADTVVILDRTLIGKPRDREHAREILQQLQGSTHTVATAHCCLRPAYADQDDVEAVALTLSKVTMRPMTLEEINTYVDSGESDNRAGAYAIQETGDAFVVDVDGAFDTVVGLNIATVRQLYLQCSGHEIKETQS